MTAPLSYEYSTSDVSWVWFKWSSYLSGEV